MCGIFGYVGKEEAQDKVLKALKRLEYRGYDSAGIAGFVEGRLYCTKSVGKICDLESKIVDYPVPGNCLIGHTRWATHGAPTVENAHPQVSNKGKVVLVHNGIVENYGLIKKDLESKGMKFVSETDTEVMAQLLENTESENLLSALIHLKRKIRGGNAFVVLHKEDPQAIFATSKDSPLVVGLTHAGSAVVASDLHACAGELSRVMFLKEHEVAILRPGSIEVYDEKGPCELRLEKFVMDIDEVSKEGFEHYMLKEIFEQPQSLKNALSGRYCDETKTAVFDEIKLDRRILHRFQRIQILACGSSWHAGLLGAALIEDLARIPVDVEISSEYRYKNPILLNDTLVIAISQSGETADTLASIRELKAKGVHILGICNVGGSSLDRIADSCILLRSGPEVSVCSTKAMTAQALVLSLFALMLGRIHDLDREKGSTFLEGILNVPAQVQDILDRSSEIEKIAKQYSHYKSFFFIGRRHMYPVSLEGALKLKEISYINANGYAAGELKHGAIALIHPECPTVAMMANEQVYEKSLSNILEIQARGGRVFAIGHEGHESLSEVANEVFLHPRNHDALNPILSSVVTQLFSYYIAKELEVNIDKPRNLAKSVTVE
jgi:glutamine---fructose-6-phosphate transaminase (isomerizing)